MIENTSRFVRGLYFDIQTVDEVKPLEIWNGIREADEPQEKSALIKNLCKIVVPLVNEECFDRSLPDHADAVVRSVKALYDELLAAPQSMIFNRCPDPPLRDPERKELYSAVKGEAASVVKRVAAASGGQTAIAAPDRIFDFRELRVIDNELPYIIFTDKEFRVIHGLVLAYLWIIDLPGVFVSLLRETGVGVEIPARFEELAEEVVKENPLSIRGRKTTPRALVSRIGERLKEGDYLDMFETVYRWFEDLRDRLAPKPEQEQ